MTDTDRLIRTIVILVVAAACVSHLRGLERLTAGIAMTVVLIAASVVVMFRLPIRGPLGAHRRRREAAHRRRATGGALRKPLMLAMLTTQAYSGWRTSKQGRHFTVHASPRGAGRRVLELWNPPEQRGGTRQATIMVSTLFVAPANRMSERSVGGGW